VRDTPDFWPWYYHLARKWRAPPDIDVPKVIGFALIMGTFGKDGRDIRPSASTLADRAKVHRITANNLRKQCVTLGLFRETGKTRSGIPILEIKIPRNHADHGDNCACSPECARRNFPHAARPVMLRGRGRLRGV